MLTLQSACFEYRSSIGWTVTGKLFCAKTPTSAKVCRVHGPFRRATRRSKRLLRLVQSNFQLCRLDNLYKTQIKINDLQLHASYNDGKRVDIELRSLFDEKHHRQQGLASNTYLWTVGEQLVSLWNRERSLNGLCYYSSLGLKGVTS